MFLLLCHIYLCFFYQVLHVFLSVIFYSLIYIPFILFISFNKSFSFNGYYFFVLIYSMVLTLMLSKSFSLITLKKHNKSAIYSLIISTLMFSLSDFIMLFILFSPYSSSILMLLNLFTYYIGQGILALNFNKLY